MRDLVTLWAKVTTHLNPGVDIILIDSNSPFDPESFLRPFENIAVHRLDGNPGHPYRGGGDGWGAAFCEGIETGHRLRYDYAACIEADLLFVRPVTPVIARMVDGGVRVACPMEPRYQF